MIEYITVPVPCAETWKQNETVVSLRHREVTLRLVRHSELPCVAFVVDETNRGTYWSLRLVDGPRVTLTCVSCCQTEHHDEIVKIARESGIHFISCRMHADTHGPLEKRTAEHDGFLFLDGNAILELLTDSEKALLKEIGTFATSFERDKP